MFNQTQASAQGVVLQGNLARSTGATAIGFAGPGSGAQSTTVGTILSTFIISSSYTTTRLSGVTAILPATSDGLIQDYMQNDALWRQQ